VLGAVTQPLAPLAPVVSAVTRPLAAVLGAVARPLVPVVGGGTPLVSSTLTPVAGSGAPVALRSAVIATERSPAATIASSLVIAAVTTSSRGAPPAVGGLRAATTGSPAVTSISARVRIAAGASVLATRANRRAGLSFPAAPAASAPRELPAAWPRNVRIFAFPFSGAVGGATLTQTAPARPTAPTAPSVDRTPVAPAVPAPTGVGSAAGAGGAAGGWSGGPGALLLSLFALALGAGYRFLLAPAAQRPAAFVSLVERPG
jgi:hypothetical protein